MTTARRSITRYLEAQCAALSECAIAPRLPTLSLSAIFQPVRVCQRSPTRPRSNDGKWEQETRVPPSLDEGSAHDERRRDWHRTHAWSDIRSHFAFPVIVLGDAGRGKSTLLAWEFCQQAEVFLSESSGGYGASAAKLPIHLRASELSCPLDDEAEGGATTDSSAARRASRVLLRIARLAGDRLGDEPAEVTTDVGREVGEALQRGAATLLIDEFTGGGDDAAAASAAAAFAANLVALLTAYPGIAVVMAARFGPSGAPDLGPIVWRVFEIVAWRDGAIDAFIDRFAEQQGSGAGARRRVREAIASFSSIAEMATNPRLLGLLCAAAARTEAAQPGTAALVGRIAELLLDSLHTDRGRPGASDRKRRIALLGRLALHLRRTGTTTIDAEEAVAIAADPRHPYHLGRIRNDLGDLVRSGILQSGMGSPPRLRFVDRALSDALAATALARDPGCIQELRPRLWLDDGWSELAILAAGEMRAGGATRPEELVQVILDEVPAGFPYALRLAARCTAEVPDLDAAMLERTVAHAHAECDAILSSHHDGGGHGEAICIDDGSQFPLRVEYAAGPLMTILGALFRTHGHTAQLGPLRHRLLALLADEDPQLRRRAVALASEPALHDPILRRSLLSRIRSEVEYDDAVRSAAVHAVKHLAERDWLVREMIVAALDARHEHDVTVRSAAAFILGHIAVHDERVRAFTASRLSPAIEPSGVVRRELIVTLRWRQVDDAPLREAFVRCLEHDPDSGVRAIGADALLVAAGEEDWIANALCARLAPTTEPNASVRAAAASSLRRPALTSERVRETLMRHLDPRREHSGTVRASAANALRFVAGSDARARSVLFASVDPTIETDAGVRAMAVSALGDAADRHEGIRSRLCQCLNARREPDARTRLHALSSLRASLREDAGLRAFLLPLLDEANEPDWNIRRTAMVYLGENAQYDSVARDALLARLDVARAGDDLRAKNALALAAVAATDDQVRAALLHMVIPAHEHDVHVRSAAIHALGHALHCDEVRATLCRQLTAWREPDPYARRCIVRSLTGVVAADERVLAVFLAAFDQDRERDASVRAAVVDVLRGLARSDDGLRRQVEGKLPPAESSLGDHMEGFFLTIDCPACAGRPV